MDDDLPFAALVLAAGTSSRMDGRNKLLMTVAAEPLIRHTVRQVLAASPREVLVVTGYQGTLVADALAGLPVRVLVNERFNEGQMASVAAGMAALAPLELPVMVCLGDMALLTPADYRELAAVFRDAGDIGCVVPFHQDRRANPVVFAPALVREIGAAGGRIHCRAWIEQHPQRVLRHDVGSDRFVTDVDTPADFTRLLERYG